MRTKPLTLLLKSLRVVNLLRSELGKIPNPLPKWFDETKRCAFHFRVLGHDTEDCNWLRHRIEHLIKVGAIQCVEEQPNANFDSVPNHENRRASTRFSLVDLPQIRHKRPAAQESEEALHNTDKDLSKVITLYIPPSRATYPTGINYEDVATIDTYDWQGNIDSQCYISDNDIAAISQVPMCKTNLKYHIDMVFYYLRKKAKMDTTSEYRYTTVNCVFMNYIHDTYTHYHRSYSEIDLSWHVENIRSMKVASVERSICEIMQGLCISVGIPWHLIDEVYVPINCKGSFHWVLAVIVLKERCIRVYDSMKDHRGHADEIKELAKIL
ncbi:hypothetical protein CQW23_10970 [Capsicum baccatum]|uniref:Ubiquitin-like protease family profile domain-containing protein n=1 Tax=Capsicum baccatum TaxID=33114 RepID=A0A2G2X186_CAPBA|nr:hypothetical protein CQW23_10970 [Capsicum baccatum]